MSSWISYGIGCCWKGVQGRMYGRLYNDVMDKVRDRILLEEGTD